MPLFYPYQNCIINMTCQLKGSGLWFYFPSDLLVAVCCRLFACHFESDGIRHSYPPVIHELDVSIQSARTAGPVQNPEGRRRRMRPSECNIAPECKAMVFRLSLGIHSQTMGLCPVALQKTKRRMGMG